MTLKLNAQETCITIPQSNFKFYIKKILKPYDQFSKVNYLKSFPGTKSNSVGDGSVALTLQVCCVITNRNKL
jgi:hypothetical protein